MSPVRYIVVASNPDAHEFNVEVQFHTTSETSLKLALPTWIPGSYLIREFARHVLRVEARCGDQSVAIHKIDKSTWQLAPCVGEVSVSFIVYGFDTSVRGAYLDRERAYFNGAALFPCVVGHEEAPCTLRVLPPEFSTKWRVATSMRSVSLAERGFGDYEAFDYAELIDHPFECGEFEALPFPVRGVPHSLVVTGSWRADLSRLANDTQRICAEHIALFHGASELPPFPRFLFLLNVLENAYGGLEHRDSTSLVIGRDDLPTLEDPTISEGYVGLLGLISHEYFHAWNVKRLLPAAFAPYDLTREAYTEDLWFYEGVTSYYDDLALVRCGLLTEGDYLRILGRAITRVWRTPGAGVQSIAEASFDAWIKFYRADENSPNSQISYYALGPLIALCIDLRLRDNGRSLDGFMRHLWTHYGAVKRPVPAGQLRIELERFSETSWQVFFDRHIKGTEPLPLEAELQGMGLALNARAASSPGDRGGKPASPDAPPFASPLALGLVMCDGSEAKVKSVLTDSPSQRAGLHAGDILVALEGQQVIGKSLTALLARLLPGSSVTMHFFRLGKLRHTTLNLPTPPRDTAWVTVKEEGETRARRRAWLRSSTDSRSSVS